jgi:hypothetical protein
MPPRPESIRGQVILYSILLPRHCHLPMHFAIASVTSACPTHQRSPSTGTRRRVGCAGREARGLKGRRADNHTANSLYLPRRYLVTRQRKHCRARRRRRGQVAFATYRTACERGLGTPAASLTTACMQAHATRFRPPRLLLRVQEEAPTAK